MTVDEQGELVTVTVAAQRTGKTPDTIRSAIRRGKMDATKGNDGLWRVRVPVESDPGSGPVPDSAQHELDRLRTELALSVRQAADSAATVAELRERLARAEGEAVAADKVEGALRELADRLTAELIDARRPWWRRLLG